MNKIELPKPLDSCSRVKIVWPSGPSDDDATARGVQTLKSFRWRVDELRPQLAPDRPWLASNDQMRAALFNTACADPNAGAVIAARGGYGAMRILELLAAPTELQPLPWIVGFSDITALHAWAYHHNYISLHAPVVTSIGQPPSHHIERQALKNILEGQPPPALPIRRDPASETVDITAPLIGGNLCLLASLAGTKWRLPEHPFILLIEEIAESPYRVDRLLQTLAMSGGLERCQAVIVGHMTGCGDNTAELLDLLASDLRRLDIPLLRWATVGHRSPNLPFLHGATYALTEAGLRCVHGRYATPTYGGYLSHSELPAHQAKNRGSRVTAGSAASTHDDKKSHVGADHHPPGISDRSLSATPLLNDPLKAAVSNKIISGYQLEVFLYKSPVISICGGATAFPATRGTTAITEHTPFDLASITKALSTSLLSGVAIEAGLVALDSRLPEHLHPAKPSLEALLTHRSGLPAHVPFFEEIRRDKLTGLEAKKRMMDLIAFTPADNARAYEYSDLGYMLLGFWLEELFEMPLDQAFHHFIAPISPGLFYATSPPNTPSKFAATERCDWRDSTLQGIVHDENAQALGGAAGHAGLFGSARAVAHLVADLLSEAPLTLSKQTIDMLWSYKFRAPGANHTLGWDTPTGERSSAGDNWSRTHGVGHLGFTGTSLWINPQSGLSVTLLTNRVHAGREKRGIAELRHSLHTAISQILPLDN